ncbi:hypothetical protein GCM10010406_04830 [Streptomyces thermolineatus]|uniref:Putative zinc-finger domain-containing protein n=1 Tax=Streptomyces thermolineatus TaxID=44033 RepID=A0ABN3KUE9_9ACTN
MSRPADPSAAHGLRQVPGPRHVHARDADAYAGGGLPEADAWRLEKHLESCGECALLVSDAVRATSVAPVLADLRAALLSAVPVTPAEERPSAAPAAEPARPARPGRTAPARPAPRRPRPRLRRPAAGSGRTGPAARAGRAAAASFGAVPALRAAWAASLAVAAVAAVVSARLAGFDGARPLLLAVAPLLPVAGVAVSYGRADPMHETVAATPSGGLRLLLVRTAGVLTVCVPLLTAAGLLLPDGVGGPGAAAWLLPGLALTVATLLLGSFTGCAAASAATSALWLLGLACLGAPSVPGAAAAPGGAAAVLRTALETSLGTVLSGPGAQTAWAACGAVCAVLLAARRTAFDRLERM